MTASPTAKKSKPFPHCEFVKQCMESMTDKVCSDKETGNIFFQ